MFLFSEYSALQRDQQQFQCKNLAVTGHLTHKDLGTVITSRNVVSSLIRGYTVDGREFAAVAQVDVNAFAKVVGKGWWSYVPIVGKAEGTLDYLGRLPQHGIPSLWREIRNDKGRYATIGSEADDHGIQIFGIRKKLILLPTSAAVVRLIRFLFYCPTWRLCSCLVWLLLYSRSI
ncbi:hypothetical protein BKA70DRAFT_410638 [Coprinopsis sp. MPI-PUGE-AT-0042]|nr:hypothetical protein BKA70DRAFT_410638 [Coprinopsis sp. MPI-PUGE-AT-0042]